MNQSSSGVSNIPTEIVVPDDLRERDQWVLWQYEDRNGRATKVPYRVGHRYASSTDPSTWTSFEAVADEWHRSPSQYAGPGFVFSADDPFCGIDLDDCEAASHQVSELLDANDPFPGAYSLEVSSPGLDRVLRTPEHFARFVDNRVKVELQVPRDGRKRYTGVLRKANAESIEMDVDNFSVSIKLAEISRARLAPL